MTLSVLSNRFSTRSNHSAICLFTWADLIRSSRLTWSEQNTKNQYETFHGYDSIHAKVGQCKAVLEKHLWEKDIQNLCLLETLEKQTKSVDKAFFQVAVVPVVFGGALNMMHH